MANSTILPFFQLPKASAKGLDECLPCAFIAANSGLSFSIIRIHIEIASSTTETRKGKRQP